MRFVVLVLLVLAVAPSADAVSKRKQCLRSCGDQIVACVETGERRRRCKRQVLKRCQREGLATCAPAGATTTTTVVTGGGGTTSTTLQGVLNGCDATTAVDRTGRSSVTIDFGGGHGLAYAPPCFRVSPGTQVSFNGEFAEHPLVGGQVTPSSMKEPDPASPFGARTDSGTSKTVVLPDAGAFPFYCDIHALAGMKGVAFVVP